MLSPAHIRSSSRARRRRCDIHRHPRLTGHPAREQQTRMRSSPAGRWREQAERNSNMRLASFKTNGRTSYGAVTEGNGIIDLGRKLKYPSLLDVFRAGALAEARAAAAGPADLADQGRRTAAADPGAGQEHLRRHQLSGPRRRVQGQRRCAEIPEPVLPFPDLAGWRRAADHPAEGVGQVRLRGRDRASSSARRAATSRRKARCR